ncbi:MAG: RNA methyltransferase [Oscillatoria sp. PMC 1051.18]|nr:RNA methyltransferase [Oscillatoria sp. PMC 1050.18]MEC5031832.1 RNA methyltransferase [Oscillatoria sp. PMC 1051.18]
MLTSLQNPLIKQLRKLQRTKERHKENLFLLEGTHLLESACANNLALVTVCCTREWRENYQQLWEIAQKRAERSELVTPELLSAIATTVNPDGVVATARRTARDSLPLTQFNLGLVLERVQDPGNLGTIIRTAVAANVDGLWISADSVDLDNPKVLRSSAGEWFKLPMAVSSDLIPVVTNLKAKGMQIVATLPQANKSYWEIDFQRPTMILLGNEGAGLSPELASLADVEAKIPLANQVESLNVAIATALLLYEARRQPQLSESCKII